MTDLTAVGTSCKCHKCVAMCSRRPCWPTPTEAASIMDAGYGQRLMLDYWAAEDSEREADFDMVVPAIAGYEGAPAPYWPVGRCTFLSAANLCEMHDLGLKPVEGRLAHHGKSSWDQLDLHEAVARTWDTPEGVAVVDRWRAAVRSGGRDYANG